MTKDKTDTETLNEIRGVLTGWSASTHSGSSIKAMMRISEILTGEKHETLLRD